MTYLNLKPVEFSALSQKTRASFKWEGRLLLPKYDGCFAIVTIIEGKPGPIFSRTGEIVKSMDHIFEDLFLRYPALRVINHSRAILGEAWKPGTEFSVISGMFRRQHAQPALGFAPFDMVGVDIDTKGLPVLYSSRPYADRVGLLSQAEQKACLVFPPCPIVCEGEAHAKRYAAYLKHVGGYDGAVCSDPDGDYIPGAGKGGEFIKVKPLITMSLRVVGVCKTVGDKTGRKVATPLVSYKGAHCGVGTGFSNAETEEWFDNPEAIIGKIIEVAAMGVSSGGVLREPRFVGIRDDVLDPDY